MPRSLPSARPMSFFLFRGWLLALLVSTLGCSGSGSGATKSDAERSAGGDTSGKPRIALIMKSLANEFFATMASGAEAHQAASDGKFELIVNGIKDERDLGRQVALVEEAMAQKVDAIVIAPADSKALVPVLKRAMDAGIVVVNIDNRLDADVLAEEEAVIPFVGPDNRAGARRVGEALVATLAAGDQVAILEGITTSFNGQQRKLGFEEALQAGGIEIVASQSAEWETSKADAIVRALLISHPELDAIVACNDSMALGALAAVRNAGQEGKIKIVGFDNITAVREAIRAGEILATADQHGDQLAVYGIDVAMEILAGKTAGADRETPVDLITALELTAETNGE